MNYQMCYDRIIAAARRRNLQPGTYSENHHIIPTALGGPNTRDNKVRLTYREHYVCHLLLTKMHTGKDRAKMICALWKVSHGSKHRPKLSSRQYEVARRIYVDHMRERRAGKPVVPKGHKFSAERNAKVAAALTGKKRAPFSEEHRANISKAQRGKTCKPRTAEQREHHRLAALKRWAAHRALKSAGAA